MRSPRKMRIEEIDEVLRGVEPMIWSILAKFNGLSKEDREDLKQEVMIHLWNKVIPKHDPRISKLSSFIYRCATNFIIRKVRKMTRERESSSDAAFGFTERKMERLSSRAIDAAKDRLEHLTYLLEDGDLARAREAVVVELISGNPNITQREIADEMGYKHPSAISMMLLRMRKRLHEKLSEDDDECSSGLAGE